MSCFMRTLVLYIAAFLYNPCPIREQRIYTANNLLSQFCPYWMNFLSFNLANKGNCKSNNVKVTNVSAFKKVFVDVKRPRLTSIAQLKEELFPRIQPRNLEIFYTKTKFLRNNKNLTLVVMAEIESSCYKGD